MGNSTTHEPPPIRNDYPAVWDLVIQDMHDRHKMGCEKHGGPLQPFNGRSAKWDKYQEALDLVAYFRQDIFEDEVKEAALIEERASFKAQIEKLEENMANMASDACEVLAQRDETISELEEARKQLRERIKDLQADLETAEKQIERYE